MAGHVSVKNFERFQHYKTRSPPWIKLYNSLLDDYEFAALPDASKAHLLAIMLLASRYDNHIPADPVWLQRRINATTPLELQTLIKLGFLIPDQECSKMLATCLQLAMPERETEGEGERETETERESLAPARVNARVTNEKDAYNGKQKRGSRLPSDWEPSSEDRDFALELGIDVESTLGEFRDYWCALPGQRGLKLDWSRTWKNRCRQIGARRKSNGHGKLTPVESLFAGAALAVAERERARDYGADSDADEPLLDSGRRPRGS